MRCISVDVLDQERSGSLGSSGEMGRLRAAYSCRRGRLWKAWAVGVKGRGLGACSAEDSRPLRSGLLTTGRWDWACFSMRTPVLSARAVRGRSRFVGVSDGVSSSGQVAGMTVIPPMRARQAIRPGVIPRHGRIRSLRHSMGDWTSLTRNLLRRPEAEVKRGIILGVWEAIPACAARGSSDGLRRLVAVSPINGAGPARSALR